MVTERFKPTLLTIRVPPPGLPEMGGGRRSPLEKWGDGVPPYPPSI